MAAPYVSVGSTPFTQVRAITPPPGRELACVQARPENKQQLVPPAVELSRLLSPQLCQSLQVIGTSDCCSL